MMFICPQCSSVDPPVAEVSSSFGCRPAYKNPRWAVLETNQGLCVKAYGEKGGAVITPMLATHQLAKAPANILRPGLEGTMWNHHTWLVERGNARSKAFKLDCDAIPEGTPHDERMAIMDRSREQLRVGPHDDRVEHDGWELMRRAGTARAA
jgi:hypothetical protein